MTSQELTNQFRFNQMTLTTLLADVSQEDSLRTPAVGGNSINWMLGHLIATRGRLLELLDAKPAWHAELSKIYNPELTNFPAKAKPMSELNRLLKDSLDEMSAALSAFEPSLSDPTDHMPHLKEGTWADRIGSYICHEAYHCGQIGLARRALGKKGLF